jgi:hypothetical protein
MKVSMAISEGKWYSWIDAVNANRLGRAGFQSLRQTTDRRHDHLEWHSGSSDPPISYHSCECASLSVPVRTRMKIPMRLPTSASQTTVLHLAAQVGQESIWTEGLTKWSIFAKPRRSPMYSGTLPRARLATSGT